MRITVDIDKKLIQIHGSFKYEQYVELFNELPEDWKFFEFEAVPVKVESVPWYVPTVTYTGGSGDPLPTHPVTTCSCSQIPLFND